MTPTTEPTDARSRPVPRGVTLAAAAPALALAAALATIRPAAAQETPRCSFQAERSELTERASPPDSSSVELGDGVVKICYGSPRVRGREIFGGLVPYDAPWRLGANEPTTLHTTVPLSVGGVELEPGSYALYAVPGPEEWQIAVNAATERWGIPIDEAVMQDDIGRATVPATSTDEPVEALRIALEPAGEGKARMAISWATTRVEVPLRLSGGGM